MLATAKIHILKQFTTTNRKETYRFQLCLLLQRYTFWSNSQRVLLYCFAWNDCACYCKDTHFEAIHNDDRDERHRCDIVLATAKIHILKQFTTTWSNSQPPNGRLCKLKLVFWLLVSLACCLTDFFLAFSWMRSWLLRRAYRLAARDDRLPNP